MPPELGERALELAKDALAEQERQVADLRTRGTTLLAVGGVVAGLLGKETFADGHPDGRLEWITAGAGLVGVVGLIASVLGLLRLRDLAFSMDARAAYTWFFTNGITDQPLVDLELADRFVQTRLNNEAALASLRKHLQRALLGLAASVAGLAAAAALAS